MSKYARFGGWIRERARVKIDLTGTVLNLGRDNRQMTIELDATGDEIVLNASDIGIAGIEVIDLPSPGAIMRQADEAVAKIEERNGFQGGRVYAAADGVLWVYDRPGNPDVPWRQFGFPDSGHFAARFPKRPLRKVAVGMTVVEEPEYETGAIYEDKNRIRFFRKHDGWALLAREGYVNEILRPTGKMTKVFPL